MRVLRLPKWALIWAQGLYIESRPTSPKAYVAGDMATFRREKNGPMPKNWVKANKVMVWTPTFEWYVVRCESKNEHWKNMCYNEIGLTHIYLTTYVTRCNVRFMFHYAFNILSVR